MYTISTNESAEKLIKISDINWMKKILWDRDEDGDKYPALFSAVNARYPTTWKRWSLQYCSTDTMLEPYLGGKDMNECRSYLLNHDFTG